MIRSRRGFTLIELLVVVAIIGVVAAIAVVNLLNAMDKGRQKRTMADLRAIGSAVEAYAVDHVVYPVAASATAMRVEIDPTYIKQMPPQDGWSHAFQVESTASSYTLYSQGKDGTGNDCTPGATGSFDDEICFSGGQFRRFPSGTQQ